MVAGTTVSARGMQANPDKMMMVIAPSWFCRPTRVRGVRRSDEGMGQRAGARRLDKCESSLPLFFACFLVLFSRCF